MQCRIKQDRDIQEKTLKTLQTTGHNIAVYFVRVQVPIVLAFSIDLECMLVKKPFS